MSQPLSFVILLALFIYLISSPQNAEDVADKEKNQEAESANSLNAESDYSEFDGREDGEEELVEVDHSTPGSIVEEVEVREKFILTAPSTVTDLPTLRFLYCVSCGYRQAFDQFSQFVREKYPHIPIEGDNFPPASWKSFVAQAVSIAKMMALVTVIGGFDPFASMGYQTPGVLRWAQGNKVSACMMTFLMSNMIENSLMSTGAFEIYLGEAQLWSKIESGRVPAPAELLQIIDTQLEVMGKIPKLTSENGNSFGNFDD